MAQRRSGQERLGIVEPPHGASALEALSGLIDWEPVGRLLVPLYPVAKGDAAWPPLAMVKALLLAMWHDLSDVKLAEALDDRASFRRFCGFARHEATPGGGRPSCGSGDCWWRTRARRPVVRGCHRAAQREGDHDQDRHAGGGHHHRLGQQG